MWVPGRKDRSLVALDSSYRWTQIDRSNALRGDASTDALRSALGGTRNVPGCIPLLRVGTIKIAAFGSSYRFGVRRHTSVEHNPR